MVGAYQWVPAAAAVAALVGSAGCAADRRMGTVSMRATSQSDNGRCLNSGIEVSRSSFGKGDEVVIRLWLHNPGPGDYMLAPLKPWWKTGLDIAQRSYFDSQEATGSDAAPAADRATAWLPNGEESWVGWFDEWSVLDTAFWLFAGDTLEHRLTLRASRAGQYRAVFQVASDAKYEMIREPLDPEELNRSEERGTAYIRNPHKWVHNTIADYYTVWNGKTRSVFVEFEVVPE